MAEETLVDADVDDAAAFAKKLDEIGEPPNFVAWYYDDDAEQWRLLVASATFDKILAEKSAAAVIRAYRRAIEVLSSIPPTSMSVSDVMVVESNSKLPSALRTIFDNGPNGIGRIRFVDNTVNGHFIKAAVIVRSARNWVGTIGNAKKKLPKSASRK